jgi:GWxTD domain-containing protein
VTRFSLVQIASRSLVLALFPLLAAGCISRGAGRADLPAPPPPPPREVLDTARTSMEAVALAQEAGMLAQSGVLPFTGTVGHLASASPDSTHLLVALSMAAEALTFRREGDQYRATYSVTLTLRRAGSSVLRIDANEVVRVAGFRETSRTDESIIFQQLLTVPPGEYQLQVEVRDDASGRRAGQAIAVALPRLEAGTLSSPLPFYEVIARRSRDSLPRLLLSPRSAAIFGRDSAIAVYIESYDTSAAPPPVRLAVRVDGRVVWEEVVTLDRGTDLRHGIAYIPVASIGLGVAEAAVSAEGRSELARTSVFVAFGDDLPVTTWEDMLNYLQYFTRPARLNALREVDPTMRGLAWSQFIAETDPQPATPEHEGLRAYFDRLRQANTRFAEDGMVGWKTDRGRVLLLLGEPDQIVDRFPAETGQRGRFQVWEYLDDRVSIAFTNNFGQNRWRLTPASEAEVENLVERRRRRAERAP